MERKYLVGDDFLDAVDDLVESARNLPEKGHPLLDCRATMVLGGTMQDLQKKRQMVQNMMDDGFDCMAEEGEA